MNKRLQSRLTIRLGGNGSRLSPGRRWRLGHDRPTPLPLLHDHDIHRHAQLLLARADDDAVDWRDIGEIAPDAEDDVIVLDQEIVGGIEADPPELLAAPERDPGV